MSKNLIINLVLLISLLSFAATAFAQTPAFVYQGKLNDGATAANGTYQFQFRLFDAVSGGNQVGQTIADLPATVTNGIFAVNLDFGVASFDGAARFLEISVRLSGGQSYTTLNPRQPVTSTPYAIRSLNANQANQSNTANSANTADNATNLGGIAANQYVLTTDPRLNQQPGGSGNYIQNSTNLQPTSNFNISGTGKADIFDAGAHYNIGGNRVLESAPNGTNVFVGFGAGNSNAAGGFNTFVGRNAGYVTTGGTQNSFFGNIAGRFNTSGSQNAFFGYSSGNANTMGSHNSFYGTNSGSANIAGSDNSFFGSDSGKANTSGGKNSFFGKSAGAANSDGNFNSFFGSASGQNNTNGIGNSFFGDTSGLLNNTGGNNSFFGKGAGLVNNSGSSNVFVGYSAGINNTTGSNNTLIGANAQVNGNNLEFATAVGAGAVVQTSNRVVIGRSNDVVNAPGQIITTDIFVNGIVDTKDFSLASLPGGGSTSVCAVLSGGYRLYKCSSSIRYKTNVQSFTGGLNIVNRLRPVTYDWKTDGKHDVGFIAEEVAEIEPLLATYNETGQIEGVKYAQITTALVNAVKEQQEQIRWQQAQIEALKSLLCAANPDVAVCQPVQK